MAPTIDERNSTIVARAGIELGLMRPGCPPNVICNCTPKCETRESFVAEAPKVGPSFKVVKGNRQMRRAAKVLSR